MQEYKEIILMKNEKKFKSIEAQRFVESVEVLIDKGLARSFKDVAEKSGFSSQDFTDIKSGKKDLQRHFLDKVSSRYGVNEVYVLTGNGAILKEQPVEFETEQQSQTRFGEDFYKKEIEMWKKLYELQAEFVAELKKERDRLRLLIEETSKK